MILEKIEILIKDKRGVLHVGAHLGEERYWYKNNGFNKVLWFEPNVNCYNRLLENLKEFPEQTGYCVGIHDIALQMPLHISSNDGMSSSTLNLKLHKKYHPHVTYIGDQIINLIRMDEFLIQNKINIDEFNMLNVDVQGTELNVIQSFGNLIDKLDYVLAEVNEAELYENCSMMSDIDRYLDAHGFVRIETYMTPCQWGDAFYLKRNLI
jgi:FkbM family methyltransferase